MFNLILFGPPGSGKGTQSIRIADKYQLKHISTGDILRTEIKEKTDLGILAKSFIDKGELVPDNVLIDILHSVIDHNKDVKGFIFDGFPRTIVQAEAMDQLMSELNDKVYKVISLVVPDKEVVDRLLKRAETEGREDDNEATIKNRLTVYHKQTSPLLDYYKKQGKLLDIEGVGSIDNIFDSICESLN